MQCRKRLFLFPLTDSLSVIVFFSCVILVRPAHVKLPAKWTNVPKSESVYHFTNDHPVVLILYQTAGNSVGFGCGFYCHGNDCKVGSYTVSIFAVGHGSVGIDADIEPHVMWSANRDRSVGVNATAEITVEGDLVVKDADGSVTWSTKTSGRSVVAMNLTDEGNLVLLDGKANSIWQSFDYPRDTLLLGQRLRVGQKLMPRDSPASQIQDDLFSISLAADGLFATVEYNSGPPVVYYSINFTTDNSSYLRFSERSLDVVADAHPSRLLMNLRQAWTIQFMSLGSDGHLRLYDYNNMFGATPLDNVLPLEECLYPTPCGHYGVCQFRACSCPSSSNNRTFFKQIDKKQPNRGCRETTPLTCGASNDQTFLEIKNLDCFNFVAHLEDVDVERCKDVCANNCSCKATFYRVSRNSSKTWCFFASELFSLIDTEESISEVEKNVTAYIKVQKSSRELPTRPPQVDGRHLNRKMNSVHIVVRSVSVAAVIVAVLVALFILWRKNRKYDESKEVYTEHIPGLPARFTYSKLEEVTEKFSKKLGMGGFSSAMKGLSTMERRLPSSTWMDLDARRNYFSLRLM